MFKYVANIHHIKYGINKYAYGLYFCKNSVISVYINITNISIHIIEKNLSFRVKKIIVHNAFTNN